MGMMVFGGMLLQWKRMIQRRTHGRRRLTSLSTSVVDGKIYAIGGWRDEPQAVGLSTVEEYNPAMDTWTKKADMPTAREFLSTSAVKGKIYTIGGLVSHFSVQKNGVI